MVLSSKVISVEKLTDISFCNYVHYRIAVGHREGRKAQI